MSSGHKIRDSHVGQKIGWVGGERSSKENWNQTHHSSTILDHSKHNDSIFNFSV